MSSQPKISELLEFAFGPGIERLKDADGRFLGEHAAAEIPASEQRTYTFRDPRDEPGGAVNFAAHAQVLDAWSSVLPMLQPGGTSAQDILDALRTAWARVVCFWLSGAVVPREVAAAYKVSQGFEQFVRTWMLTQPKNAVLPNERELLARLDAEAWLLGDFLVCPASRRSIAEAWCVLRGEPAASFVSAAAYSPSEHVRAWRHGLGRLEVGLMGLLACDADDESPNAPQNEVLRAWTRGSGQLGVHLEVIERVPVPSARVLRLRPPGCEDSLCEELSAFKTLLLDVLQDVQWPGASTFDAAALRRLRTG